MYLCPAICRSQCVVILVLLGQICDHPVLDYCHCNSDWVSTSTMCCLMYHLVPAYSHPVHCSNVPTPIILPFYHTIHTHTHARMHAHTLTLSLSHTHTLSLSHTHNLLPYIISDAHHSDMETYILSQLVRSGSPWQPWCGASQCLGTSSEDWPQYSPTQMLCVLATSTD